MLKFFMADTMHSFIISQLEYGMQYFAIILDTAKETSIDAPFMSVEMKHDCSPF